MGTPIINGNKYGWASISLGIDGTDQTEFTAINYTVSQEIGKVRGKGSRKRGRTKGDSDSEGSFTLLKKQGQALVKKLGKGFMAGKRDFPIVVSYDETGEDEIITDSLLSCRIITVENAPAQGTEPATMVFTIDIGAVLLNGIDPQDDG